MKKNTVDMINIAMLIAAITVLLIVNLFTVSAAVITAFRAAFVAAYILNAILIIKTRKFV